MILFCEFCNKSIVESEYNNHLLDNHRVEFKEKGSNLISDYQRTKSRVKGVARGNTRRYKKKRY